MEEITSLREKHLKVTPSQIKDLLQRQMKYMDHMKSKEEQNITENNNKIEDLASKIASMKESLQAETQSLEHKNRELSQHLDTVRELEAEKNKYLQQNHALELQRNKLRLCKPNARDEELLEAGQRKFRLYKELTRIRWDFEVLNECIKGYVSNKSDYIRHFHFKPNDSRHLSDSLWEEIYRSTCHRSDKNEANKENTAHN